VNGSFTNSRINIIHHISYNISRLTITSWWAFELEFLSSHSIKYSSTLFTVLSNIFFLILIKWNIFWIIFRINFTVVNICVREFF
jgi:hypothetical protein